MGTISAWFGLIAGILTCGIWCGSAIAQVTPDRTLHTSVSQSGNNFTITDGNHYAQNPNQQVQMSDVYDGLRLPTWSDIRDLSTYRKTGEVTPPISSSPEVLVQATSWHRNAQGKVELIANKSPTQVQQALTCAAVKRSNGG